MLLRVTRRPRRHHEALEPARRDRATAVFHQLAHDFVGTDLERTPLESRPVRAARHLVEASAVELAEEPQALAAPGRGVVEFLVGVVIVPVRLKDGLRALSDKVGVVPSVVAPDPRPRPRLLAAPHQADEVVVPELAAAHARVFAMVPVRLGDVRLLVAAQVEIPRAVEYLAGVADHVVAEVVVRLRGHHAAHFAHPSIVGGREVQLGNRLDAERLQPPDLVAHLVRTPRIGDRQLGMARQAHAFADVDDKRV